MTLDLPAGTLEARCKCTVTFYVSNLARPTTTRLQSFLHGWVEMNGNFDSLASVFRRWKSLEVRNGSSIDRGGRGNGRLSTLI